MSDRLTDCIEPLALATQGRSFEGNAPVSALQRLGPLLGASGSLSGEDKVEYTLRFGLDAGGVPNITGSVRAVLVLQCQRCMEDMVYPVSTEVCLGIATSREAAEHLPDNYDPLIVNEGEITIVSILEDELILAVPIVAMHEIEACSLGDGVLQKEGLNLEADQENMSTSKRENPFAVLAQLKKTQPEDSAAGNNIDSANPGGSKKNEE